MGRVRRLWFSQRVAGSGFEVAQCMHRRSRRELTQPRPSVFLESREKPLFLDESALRFGWTSGRVAFRGRIKYTRGLR